MNTTNENADSRFTFAFYGVNPNPKSFERFYQTVLAWFTDLGFRPNRLAITGVGYSGKAGDFDSLNARLNKKGFAGIRAIDIDSGKPGAIVAGLEYFGSATISDLEGTGGYLVVSIPAKNASDCSWHEIADDLVHTFSPHYGIAYFRDLSHGPVLYAIGIGYGEDADLDEEAYEAARNRSRWSNVGMRRRVYLNGVLRDVYPRNFLTQPQLSAKVSGVPLGDWIKQDPARGSLAPFAGEVSLWQVKESQIPSLQSALKDIIFNWRNYLE